MRTNIHSKIHTIILLFLVVSLMIITSFLYRLQNEVTALSKKIDDLDVSIKNYQSTIDNINNRLMMYDLLKEKLEKSDVETPSHNTEIEKVDAEDLNLLAKLIEAEAGNQSINGKLAVGTVVMNRVESGKFPNDIEGVVFQENQFSVVDNGTIDNNPSIDSINAAKDILNGERTLDPNVLFFYNPDIVKTNNWIRGRKTSKVIDDHVFTF